VHKNGPSEPYTVNPFPGHPEGQSTGNAKVTYTSRTVRFSFTRKSIGNPKSAKIRALGPGAEDAGTPPHTSYQNIEIENATLSG
jgi:hypothetical protein